jgi:hypothetical protein
MTVFAKIAYVSRYWQADRQRVETACCRYTQLPRALSSRSLHEAEDEFFECGKEDDIMARRVAAVPLDLVRRDFDFGADGNVRSPQRAIVPVICDRGENAAIANMDFIRQLCRNSSTWACQAALVL